MDRVNLFKPREKSKIQPWFQDRSYWQFKSQEERSVFGRLLVQDRWLDLEVAFPIEYPFREPNFRFHRSKPTHPCIDDDTGEVAQIWGVEYWSPHAATPDTVLQSLISVLNSQDIKGKARVVGTFTAEAPSQKS